MFWNNIFSVIADNWVPNHKTGGQTNVGKHESGLILQEWHVPNDVPGRSGRNYVQLDDGRIFYRYDIYDPASPYGWNEIKRSDVTVPALDAPDIRDYVKVITSLSRDPFSWLSTKEVCQVWQASFAAAPESRRESLRAN